MSFCATATNGRKRTFWATQPDACGSGTDQCGDTCGAPGLVLTSSRCGGIRCECCPSPVVDPECGVPDLPQAVPRSIVTTNWLRGLVLNILGTDGKLPDKACGYAPGVQGGHWGDSFRGDGQRSGTLIRTKPLASSVREAVNLVHAQLEADLAKLIVMRVATKVEVNTAYLGGLRMRADVIVHSPQGQTARVGVDGTRAGNDWIWF